MSTKRIILRVLIFAMICALLFVYLNQVFKMTNGDTNRQIYNTFYAQTEDTDDVLYVGTSAANRYFISPMCYKETGTTVYNLSVMGMPLFLVKDAINEAEKTQDPQLYIIELRWVLKSYDQITDAHIRRVTDSMHYFGERNTAIQDAFDFLAPAEETELTAPIDYYIPMIKFHSKVTAEISDMDITDWTLTGKKNKAMGYVLTHNTITVKPQPLPYYSDERAPLTTEAEGALNDLLDYLDKQGKDVLFVMSPYSVKDGDKAKFNTAIDIVEDRGYTVLDFNTPEMNKKLGLDFNKDFYNSKHTNWMGAEKYTKYLTAYLKEHYDLPDHRGDKKYADWDTAYDNFKKFISNHKLKYVENKKLAELNKERKDAGQ